MSGSTSSVLVIVGTDHHPFDRVVRWVDAWLSGLADPPAAVVQHGTSVLPTRAEGHMLIAPVQLHRLIEQASVVVTHGGPASIAEVRRLGRLPVVVPRDPARGEHVDGHQQRFSRRMAERGWLVLCETQEQLTAALDAGMTDPSRFLLHGSDDSQRVAASVDAVSRILDEVVAAARAGVASRRRGQLAFRQETGGRAPSLGAVPAQMTARQLADSGEGVELS